MGLNGDAALLSGRPNIADETQRIAICIARIVNPANQMAAKRRDTLSELARAQHLAVLSGGRALLAVCNPVAETLFSREHVQDTVVTESRFDVGVRILGMQPQPGNAERAESIRRRRNTLPVAGGTDKSQ